MSTQVTNIKPSQFFVPEEIEAIARRMYEEPQPWLDVNTVMGFRSFVDNTWVREFTTPEGTARELGIREVQYVDYQPYSSKGYPSLKEMREQARQSGVLLIATEGAECWLLGRDTNLRFRAIHDLHHLAENANFSVDGETKAAIRLMGMTDNPVYRELVFSEIIAQRCYYELYGTYMDEQKALLGWNYYVHTLLKHAE